MNWVFWGSLGLVVYTYAGYPLLLAIVTYLNKLTLVPKRPPKVAPPQPTVSVALVVHNEEQRVLSCIENLLHADYPKLIEVLVVCDRCDDNTGPVAAKAGGPKQTGGIENWVRVIDLEKGREGRAAGLNQAVAFAKGDVVVFADIDLRFKTDTISKLVAPFADKKVGAVSGVVELESRGEQQKDDLDVGMELEKLIRRKESELYSTIECTGSIFAVRGEAYQAIRDDTILDNVVIPMKIALAGYRVLFEPEARAVDPLLQGEEEGRWEKVRAFSGNWQMLFRYPAWFLPWVNHLSWQLISHNYLRLLGPVFLVAALVSNMTLLDQSWLYWLTFVGQIACYLLGVAGLFHIPFRWKSVVLFSRVSGAFLDLQAICTAGFVSWIGGFGRASHSGAGGRD